MESFKMEEGSPSFQVGDFSDNINIQGSDLFGTRIPFPSTGESISQFYSDKSVLITGATGFLGKVLVEKLLRSCPNLKRLYILMRSKSGQTVEQRLDELLKSNVFDGIRGDVVFNKIRLITGDILADNLGISSNERAEICDECNVVFHSAATIRFDEKLRLAVAMNVVGVQKMISLCREMKKLEAFIHVSTAYANCNLDQISETIYPPPVEPQKLLDALEWMTDDMIDAITPKIIGDRPNTYTYTKAMAEYVLMTEARDLPVAVVRPSIVGAAWREPITGWIDNFNGPAGIIVAVGKGLLRIMKADLNATADIIPVDVTVNLLIATAWCTATHKPNTLMVYNSTSGNINRVTWGRVEKGIAPSWRKNPADKMLRVPNAYMTNNSLWYQLKIFFDHNLPAFFIDYYNNCIGRKSNLRRVYKSIHRAVNTFDYFTCNQWDFTVDNTQSLLLKLSDADRQIFNFDVRDLDWEDYIEKYCLGTKRFLLKEDLVGLPAARSHLRRLQTIGTCFNVFLFIFTWRFLIARSNLARKLWYFVTVLVVKLVKSMPWMARS